MREQNHAKNNRLLKLPKAIFLDLDDTLTTFDLSSGPAWQESTEWFVKRYEPQFEPSKLIAIIKETKKWYWGDQERHKRGRENLFLARCEVITEALRRYAGEEYFREETEKGAETGGFSKANPMYSTKERILHIEEFAALYMKLHNERICPLDGAIEALDIFKKLRIRLAIVTNGVAVTQREKLLRFGLTERFEHIFIDTEIGFSKPDARIFQYALEKMKLKPWEVFMIGDNIRWDVGGPQEIGITGVWINTKQVELPSDFEIVPDLQFDSLLEFSKTLKSEQTPEPEHTLEFAKTHEFFNTHEPLNSRTLVQIAHIQSDFATKFGIPRQSGLVEELRATIVFEPEFRSPEALRGLEGFSHLWLLWDFSETKKEGFTPTVRPPRLGGNTRMGVFATCSPFRPNPIGLSCVRIASIRHDEALGPVIEVFGADLMNNTPIYDIKPYLPYTDAHPEAKGGFASEHERHRLRVEIPKEQLEILREDKRSGLYGILAEDPRPSYQEDPKRSYGLVYAGYEVKFHVSGGLLTVYSITKET